MGTVWSPYGFFQFCLEHTFEYLVEGQPIGEQLFKQFCSKDPQLTRCIEYLSAVKKFNMATDEKCVADARSVFDEYISIRVRRGEEGGKGKREGGKGKERRERKGRLGKGGRVGREGKEGGWVGKGRREGGKGGGGRRVMVRSSQINFHNNDTSTLVTHQSPDIL